MLQTCIVLKCLLEVLTLAYDQHLAATYLLNSYGSSKSGLSFSQECVFIWKKLSVCKLL